MAEEAGFSKSVNETTDAYLTEIGRVTTTWSLFEQEIDKTIWDLAKVDDRLGACITSQVVSIYARFRVLNALMRENGISQGLIKKLDKLSEKAGDASNSRNLYAHSPLQLSIDLDEKEFKFHLKQIAIRKGLIFESVNVSPKEINEAENRIFALLSAFRGLRVDIYSELREKRYTEPSP